MRQTETPSASGASRTAPRHEQQDLLGAADDDRQHDDREGDRAGNALYGRNGRTSTVKAKMPTTIEGRPTNVSVAKRSAGRGDRRPRIGQVDATRIPIGAPISAPGDDLERARDGGQRPALVVAGGVW